MGSREDRLATELFRRYGSVEKGKYRSLEQWEQDAEAIRDMIQGEPIRMEEVGLEEFVRAILSELDLSGEHFDQTPSRVAAMLWSFRQNHNLAQILATGFEEVDENVMVVQGNIPFKGLCAHHLLPFFGSAVVGYVPNGRIVGLSKLTRLVQAAGELQPTTQEDITNRIVDTISDVLRPIGAGVVTRALHGCMAVRGVHAPNTWTTVSALKGQFLLNPIVRSEFMELARGQIS